jgi:hypothetical protein
VSATYEFVIRRPDGLFVDVIGNKDYLSADYTLKLNNVGALTLDLPAGRYPISRYDQDYRIEIWRKVRGGINYLEGETCFLVSHLEQTRTKSTLQADTANRLLKHHVVSYQDTKDESFVLKILPLDDMIKNAFRENYGIDSPTYTTGSYNQAQPDLIRFLNEYIQVQANSSSWPTARRRITHDVLLDVAITCSEKAGDFVTYYFFDLVQINHTGGKPFLELRTYVGQRGTDRRHTVTLSEEEKTLSDAKLIFDWDTSFNRIYAGGPGQKADRLFATADSPDLAETLARNPLGLRERFYDTRKAKDQAETDGEADGQVKLPENKPYSEFDATVTESGCQQYGRTYFFGDRVSAYGFGRTIDTFVSPVHVHVEAGKEQFDIHVTEKVNTYAKEITKIIKDIAGLQRRLRYIESIDTP